MQYYKDASPALRGRKTVRQVVSKLILPDHTIRLKLLGDSITHGAGGTGFMMDGEPIVEGFRRSPNGHCWANLFRDYIEDQYDCRVINNACTGTDIGFVISSFDRLVDKDDDIVICTIGTNNRHKYFSDGEKPSRREYMESFYRQIAELDGLFQKAGKDVIFCANIPASPENEKDGQDYWRIFHMNDVHDLYLKASAELGFPMISLYTAVTDYCAERGLKPGDLLCDGLHPSDFGHDVIFHLILRELGLAERVC